MSKRTETRGGRRTGLVALLAVLVVTVAAFAATSASAKPQAGNYIIGVSNTLIGNGWRDEMICAIKAQSTASGLVKQVKVINRNGGAAEQSADIRNLISAGANAIVINPSSSTALNAAIAQASSRGVKVVSVDQRVTAPQAYNATNDQVAYGRLGAQWLFKALHGKGNVVEMRGIAGVPADTDRHTGFMQAKAKYPGIKVIKTTYSNWTYATGGKQMLDILNSGTTVDGVWTSGIDYTVVNAFKTAGKPYVPIVGADNNGFLKQLLNTKGLRGAAVTNPATIGGVGASIALKLLQGKSVPKWVKLTPQLWDNGTAKGKADIKANYSPSRAPTYSARLQVKPWTTYTTKQLFACK
jgi:ribose transport system substrate-binding protein